MSSKGNVVNVLLVEQGRQRRKIERYLLLLDAGWKPSEAWTEVNR